MITGCTSNQYEILVFRPSSNRFIEVSSWKKSSSLDGYSIVVLAENQIEVLL